MLILDVNIVLTAYRADHVHHTPIRKWFDAMLASGEDFGLPVAAWTAFVRLSTNARIFLTPTTLAEAFDFIDSVRAQPGYVSCEPGGRHLALVRRLCEEADASGDLLADAVLGAVALEHGATVVSLDRDFARFDSVPHIRPPT